MLFPSDEWFRRWVDVCNADPVFQDAGRGWEGAVGAVVKADRLLAASVFVRLTGSNGRWDAVDVESTDDLLDAVKFTLTAECRVWEDIIHQQLDPVRAMIQGRVRVRGQLLSVLRWTRAMNRMTVLAGGLDTEFPDGSR